MCGGCWSASGSAWGAGRSSADPDRGPGLRRPDNGTIIRIASFTPLALPLYAVLVVLLAGVRRAAHRPEAPGRGGSAGPGRAGPPRVVVRPAGGRRPPGTAHQGAERVTVMNAIFYEGRATRRRSWTRSATTTSTSWCWRRSPPPARADGRSRPRRAAARPGRGAGLHGGRDDDPGDPPADRPCPAADHLPGLEAKYGALTVLGVHPVRRRPAGWRADHAAILRQAEADQADLIVGDMNATPDHDVMRSSTTPGSATRGRRPTRAGSRPGPPTTSGFSRCCRRWWDRPRADRRVDSPRSAPTRSTSTAQTTWPWSRRWLGGERDGPPGPGGCRFYRW